jgi:hypothetical protein
MASDATNLVITAIGAGALLMFWREILETLNKFSGRGPRPPSHPLPAADAHLLRRRKSTAAPRP